MDSEHRHDLKTNELADWTSKLPKFVQKNFMQIIGVCLIVAAILFSGPVRRRIDRNKLAKQAETTSAIRKAERGKIEAVQNKTEAALIVSANELEIAGQEAKSESLSALAFIKRAEAIRASLHYGAEDPEAEIVSSELGRAKGAYEQALAKAKASGSATLSAKAEYGLGLCAEEAGDFAGASEIYTKIAGSEDYSATVFPKQAQSRLDGMEDNKAEFEFVDAPEPEADVLESAVSGAEVKAVESVVSVPVDITVEPEENKAVEPVVE